MGTCPTENAAMCSLFAARSPIMFAGGALVFPIPEHHFPRPGTGGSDLVATAASFGEASHLKARQHHPDAAGLATQIGEGIGRNSDIVEASCPGSSDYVGPRTLRHVGRSRGSDPHDASPPSGFIRSLSR